MNHILRNFSLHKTSLLSNVLWLIFALMSFLCFPYLGMVTFPCRHSGGKKASPARSIHWSPYSDILRKYEGFNVSSNIPSSDKNNSSVPDIMMDQRRRMDLFCASHNIPTTVYREAALHDLHHHFLVDDTRKILFCYVPKVGCSNWKRVFLILAGIVDPEERGRPSIDIFRQVKSLESYTPKEQQYRLKSYFKFMFIRSPSERVLSAYRNKIEHPLITNPEEQTIWDEVRYTILSSYRIKFNNEIAKEEKKLFPTFSEFLHFLYDSDPVLMNEHYKPVVELCQPCAIKYDFVGNFATLRRDANAILNHLKINSSMFWDRGKHIKVPTVSHVKKYYKGLSAVDFKRLEERFEADLALYNHLFPLEDDGGYSQLKSKIWQ